MQSVSSRIWIRVDVSISCDDNHYTTGTSRYVIIINLISLAQSARAVEYTDYTFAEG